MHVPVIFEDTNIIVIDKPSGIVMHPFDFSNEQTILDFLQKNYSEIFTIDNFIILQDKRRVSLGGIVHKLDRDTSGVVVIAKNQKTFNELREQFSNHTTSKSYVALVEGIMEKDSFRIDAPLGRGKKDYKQSTNPINPRGELREAITDVEVLQRSENKTLAKLTPHTGRTHQLRAHMSSIGYPIIGDIAYGSSISSPRIMLHAETITFTLDTIQHSYTAPRPETF